MFGCCGTSSKIINDSSNKQAKPPGKEGLAGRGVEESPQPVVLDFSGNEKAMNEIMKRIVTSKVADAREDIKDKVIIAKEDIKTVNALRDIGGDINKISSILHDFEFKKSEIDNELLIRVKKGISKLEDKLSKMEAGRESGQKGTDMEEGIQPTAKSTVEEAAQNIVASLIERLDEVDKRRSLCLERFLSPMTSIE